MGYDIHLRDPVTGNALEAESPHQVRGGTYAVGGTTKLWLSVTYNYWAHFRRVFGEEGIRSIYGKTGAESIPMLQAAMAQLGDDVDPDYWKATEGNAKQSLAGLLAFAQLRPDGVWNGD